MTSISFDVLSFLQSTLGNPSTKVPGLGLTTMSSYALPPIALYYTFAALALIPGTRTIRVALWPVIGLSAWRAAVSVDMISLDQSDRRLFNVFLVLAMLHISVRTLDWTLAKGPLVRHSPAGKSIVLDALDLASNIRGHGWNWSRGTHIPHQTRPPNYLVFVFYTSFSAIVHAFIYGTSHRAVLAFIFVGSEPTSESTIFDKILPFPVQYLRASFISFTGCISLYAFIQMAYDMCTIPAILVLGQDPAQWPPAFDSPWLSTSLGDFWTRRWHQFFRQTFLFTGSYPLSFVFGRAGRVLGAFLASAVLHNIALVAVDGRAEIWRMHLGFGMMGLGKLAEEAFYHWTGRRVGGVIGWAWTMMWLALWGPVIADGFARSGLLGCAGAILDMMPVPGPVCVAVEHWVAVFDVWLHTVSY